MQIKFDVHLQVTEHRSRLRPLARGCARVWRGSGTSQHAAAVTRRGRPPPAAPQPPAAELPSATHNNGRCCPSGRERSPTRWPSGCPLIALQENAGQALAMSFKDFSGMLATFPQAYAPSEPSVQASTPRPPSHLSFKSATKLKAHQSSHQQIDKRKAHACPVHSKCMKAEMEHDTIMLTV